MTIALIHNEYSAELISLLSPLGKVEVFTNQFQLWDYLVANEPCDLVVSATDGALGMNVCTTARERREDVLILWLTEQKEFEPQSKRTPVDAFLVKPIALSEVFETAKQLLENPPKKGSASEPILKKIAPHPVAVAMPPQMSPKKRFDTWLHLFLNG